MKITNFKLQDLLEAVEEINPQLTDYWQATAIIESLGYTDRIIQKEFNFPHALALGQYIYEHYNPLSITKSQQKPISLKRKLILEIIIFIEQFSRSFVYAVPLILMLFFEYFGLKKEEQLFPPQLASLLTIATLGSLCASGGFVQMISQRGQFYLKLGESLPARRVCISILFLGTATSIILCCLGLWFGFYRGIYADEYLILAAFYYLILSLLWMLIAIFSVHFSKAEPLVIIGLSSLFVFFRLQLGIEALEAQILATLITFGVVIILVAITLKKNKIAQSLNGDKVTLPRLSALVYLLYPYFIYGVAYFAFIFADRLIAGLSIYPLPESIFAIDSNYRHKMDLALLSFLITVPLIEYLGYKFIRYWYDSSKNLTSKNLNSFSRKLKYFYAILVVTTILLFILLSMLLIGVLKPENWGIQEVLEILFGCLGYLFFILGLLNSILLFSLNQSRGVLKALLLGLTINVALGYLLAHLINSSCAIFGLVIGAFTFMFLSSYQVMENIKHSDYAYYLGGY